MACANRFSDALRASMIRRLPVGCATRRRDDVSGVRRRANGNRDAGRGAVACRTACPAFDTDDVAASEGGS
ncbi:hypothetical protein CFB82_18630 [Burkholderia sp. HI2714]|uniref:hypothetical protein n=1 Tax=Burkholderia sp. HI2714 TaxID=2015359 RepID=UPI000B7AEA4F|nr:hypothetical protein [Burkholderia sp. HI2714]OXJ32418.1 hypothetical protein CFB82_18630 [Burkholderia sp. HI2714]